MFQAAQGMGGHAEPGQDNPTADNSEMVYISSLSLLKVKEKLTVETMLCWIKKRTRSVKTWYLTSKCSLGVAIDVEARYV